MSKMNAVREFVKAVVVFRLSRGQTIIPRKEVFEALHREDPRASYGSNPLGADLTSALMKSIAVELGGDYKKDSNGQNARFEF